MWPQFPFLDSPNATDSGEIHQMASLEVERWDAESTLDDVASGTQIGNPAASLRASQAAVNGESQ